MNINNICLYCGKHKESKWDEYTNYYECDCYASKRNRQIDKEISDLEMERPKKRFKISQCIEPI